jgi:hypothetical protein
MNNFKLGDKNRTLRNVVAEKMECFVERNGKKKAQAPRVHGSCG